MRCFWSFGGNLLGVFTSPSPGVGSRASAGRDKISAMSNLPQGFIAMFQQFVGRLKSPQLLWLVGSLFILDLFVPDPIPFIDEIMLGIVTLLIARWKDGRSEVEPMAKPAPKNVTPDPS